jgi:ubiquinone/menaquinone biosynthesis C-methylase UbiE
MMGEIKHVFDFQAQVGLTKHLGSEPATRQLAKMCQVLPGYEVLDVGCGAGMTPIFLAQEFDLQVVGVDIHPGMVASARALAQRKKMCNQVEFRQADAQALPFEDDSFDAVIVESVTVFTEDMQNAVNEYARVTKPGGYVGMNETTYLQPDTPEEIRKWAAAEFSGNAEILNSAGWQALLENAGLEAVTARIFPLDIKRQVSLTMKRYGLRELLRTWSKAFKLYLTNPDMKEHLKSGSVSLPKGVMDHLGYGLYVGRVPD